MVMWDPLWKPLTPLRPQLNPDQAVEKSLAIFYCYTADSETDTGRHHLYNNGLLVLFSTAWS